MTNQRKHALVLSCEVPGEQPLPGAGYNSEKLSRFFRRSDLNVKTQCVFGGKLTIDRAKEDIIDFFSIESDVHILYGIFHGLAGSWKLSDGNLLGLDDILEKWDVARQQGTAQQLLIVSDACQSGRMVEKANDLGRTDVAVQASCRPGEDCSDDRGETFTELLLWHLQGCPATNRMDSDKERALRTRCGPRFYCPHQISFRDWWIFIDEEDGANHSFATSLAPTSSETSSQCQMDLEDAPSRAEGHHMILEQRDASSWRLHVEGSAAEAADAAGQEEPVVSFEGASSQRSSPRQPRDISDFDPASTESHFLFQNEKFKLVEVSRVLVGFSLSMFICCSTLLSNYNVCAQWQSDLAWDLLCSWPELVGGVHNSLVGAFGQSSFKDSLIWKPRCRANFLSLTGRNCGTILWTWSRTCRRNKSLQDTIWIWILFFCSSYCVLWWDWHWSLWR